MRTDGYYWVKWKTKWIVAEYQDGLWFLSGLTVDFDDSDFAEIDETPIVRGEGKVGYLMDIDNEGQVFVIAENISEAMDKAAKVSKNYRMVIHKSLRII
jgi:hypothetical protein